MKIKYEIKPKPTILDWLKTIPDEEIREKAIANYNSDFIVGSIPAINCIGDAINYAFEWESTQEGHNFWSKQMIKYSVL